MPRTAYASEWATWRACDVSRPGPNDEVRLAVEALVASLTGNLDIRETARSIAGGLGKLQGEKLCGGRHTGCPGGP
ncbi:MAG: hypothetical protein AB1921_09215 [Thermodesulfobacteriota bacterium]